MQLKNHIGNIYIVIAKVNDARNWFVVLFMTYRGKKQVYLCLLAVIIAALVITVPGGACPTSTTPAMISCPTHGSPRPVPAWYSCAWGYRKAITIDHARVPGSQTNFWVLISLPSDPGLSEKAQPSGNYILFTAADGTTKLPHRIESYRSSTGALVAWVNIPSVSRRSDTVIYMYYSNPGASNQQNPAALRDPRFAGARHMKSPFTFSRRGPEQKAPSQCVCIPRPTTTPTPTPTPTPSPTPTPTPIPFSCPDTAESLVTPDGTTAGCVAVSNDAVNLSVTFTANPSVPSESVDWAWGYLPSEIPDNGVPNPADFPYRYTFTNGQQSYQSPGVDISEDTNPNSDVTSLVLSAHALTQSGEDAWADPPLDYFNYPIETVSFAFQPDPSTGQLPGGASQTITVTAYDRLNEPIPGLLLTFSSNFGSFPNGGQLTTGVTGSNGQVNVTVSSSVAGTATLTAWTDYNNNGILDPPEWTSSSMITWLPASTP